MGTIYRRVILVGLSIALLWTMAGPRLIAPVRRAMERGIVLSLPLPGDLRAVVRIGGPSESDPEPQAAPDPCRNGVAIGWGQG